MNTPVSRLIGPRGTIVHTTPTDSVLSASKLMTAENTGSVLILDNSGSLIGIFTERDLLTRVVAADLDPAATAIATVMSRDVVTVRANALRRDVHNIMKAKNVRHVPIIEGNEVVGIVSLRDILRSANAEKDFEIGQLRDYVTNRPYPSYPG